jgi:PKD repeat protein
LNGYAYVKTLTWGSGFLWAGGTERITQIDISDDTANVAGAYSGKTIEPALMVAWDGEYMWSNSDAVNLVRLDVGDIGEPNNPPNTSFSYSPTKPAAGQEVSLDASGSSDSEGYIAQYQWDFDGDGVSEARGEQVTHTFDSTGQHTIELTVVDNNEATSKINKTIKITQRTSTTDVVQSTSAVSATTEKTTDETKSVSSTDPPESPSETVTRNTVTNMPTEERSSSAEPPSSSNEVQRGFFSNGPNSGSLDPLANPFLLTLGGFIFSAAGILLQLSRGG